ncbi:MAG: hypothetical protein AAF826_06360 [Pseudomonadota bacterium]
MFELAFTDRGLRPANAPCKSAIDWVSGHMAVTRDLEIRLGDIPQNTQSYCLDIPFSKQHVAKSERHATELAGFLHHLTDLWSGEISIKAYGFGALLVIDSYAALPKSGIKSIDIYNGCAYSLSTFLKLDTQREAPAPIQNHIGRIRFRNRTGFHLLQNFGPADRPIARGYPFRHNFWTDCLG